MSRPRRKAAPKDAQPLQSPGMKTVHNRNKYKIELVVNGAVVVILPGKSVQLPVEYKVPENIGLYVRR